MTLFIKQIPKKPQKSMENGPQKFHQKTKFEKCKFIKNRENKKLKNNLHLMALCLLKYNSIIW